MPALTCLLGVDASEYVRFHFRFRQVSGFGNGRRWLRYAFADTFMGASTPGLSIDFAPMSYTDANEGIWFS